MKTPTVEWWTVPATAIWDLGQLSKQERASLEARARRGELTKVRARWRGISPLKTVFY